MSFLSASSISSPDAYAPEHSLSQALDAARAQQHEDPAGALAIAQRCEREARSLDSSAGLARALAIQGLITLHQGDMSSAFQLAAAAEALAEVTQDDTATVDVSALGAHLNFFAGSYPEALRHAERGIAVADWSGDLALRIYARRSGCMVLGNLEAPEWPQRLEELLALSQEGTDRWEEAVSRNDLAHYRMTLGDFPAALAQIDVGLELAAGLAPNNRFVIGLLTCTRAEILLAAERADDALAHARRAMQVLRSREHRDPYLLGMCVMVEARALLAVGRPDEAWRTGQRAVEWLGDGVPQLRSMILQDVAAALREAGRSDDAYTALAASAELERVAFRQLTELQRDFERALHEHAAARREADVLVEKNQELERRALQLEQLQEQLRAQAERDWLTGLYNRRYLAAALERLDDGAGTEPLSLAIADLDLFKGVNDRFGHDVGDRVLVRAAELLRGAVRPSDVVARTGGEEFVVLMPVADHDAATACAERLCATFAAERWHEIAPGLVVTASIGVASTSAATGAEDLLKLADRRLYAAKHAGRNRIDADSFADS
jgi:diguanylate cyclase (GGDEF)-like protein